MEYDLIILDDNALIHCPPHFYEKLSSTGLIVGYNNETLPNFIEHRQSPNPVIRRIFKLCTSLPLLFTKKRRLKVLIYDDVLSAVIVSILFGWQHSVSLRLTHLKDREVMPWPYYCAVYYMLRISRIRTFCISMVMRRYLKLRFDIQSTLWPSRAERLKLNPMVPLSRRNSLVYSGTIQGRNFIENFQNHIAALISELDIEEIFIIAPYIDGGSEKDIYATIEKFNSVTVNLSENLDSKQIGEIYSRAKFGYAFYDWRTSSNLRQNFPLKTLEYIGAGVLPVVNMIHAHRELVRQGYKLVDIEKIDAYADATLEESAWRTVNFNQSWKDDVYFFENK